MAHQLRQSKKCARVDLRLLQIKLPFMSIENLYKATDSSNHVVRGRKWVRRPLLAAIGFALIGFAVWQYYTSPQMIMYTPYSTTEYPPSTLDGKYFEAEISFSGQLILGTIGVCSQACISRTWRCANEHRWTSTWESCHTS